MAQTFDVTFKYLFRNSTGVLARLLFGESPEWQNVEQPEVRNLRPDLLARGADGQLRHVELQIKNDRTLPFRMLEYYVGFRRAFDEHVHQTLLYAGREPLSMPHYFSSASTRHEFHILNLREMDGAELLASSDWTDNEWALLTRCDPEKVIRVVLDKLRTLDPNTQQTAASTFFIIGGILGIEDELKRRVAAEMIDLLENKVLGPAIRQGLEQGRVEGRMEGRVEGRVEGRMEGMAHLLESLLEKRFGPLPAWAKSRIQSASVQTIEAWSLRLDEVASLDQLLN